MSGGSLDYFYHNLEENADALVDRELVELAHDLADLFHDREWYDSGDYSEGTWNQSVLEFKNKWLRNNANDRIKEQIEQACKDFKLELQKSYGVANWCKDCKNFKQENDSYGECPNCNGHMTHKYETCSKFEKKEGEEK